MEEFCRWVIVFGAASLLMSMVQLSCLWAGEFEYVGVAKCKTCHSKERLGGTQFQHWEETAHAKAIETLKPGVKVEAKVKSAMDPHKDYSSDPECLKCHTTGYEKPAAEGAKLEGVQCEACHGPGSAYKSMKIMSKKKYRENRGEAREKAISAGLVFSTEEVCAVCHNQEGNNFEEFDFETKVEQVKHTRLEGKGDEEALRE